MAYIVMRESHAGYSLVSLNANTLALNRTYSNPDHPAHGIIFHLQADYANEYAKSSHLLHHTQCKLDPSGPNYVLLGVGRHRGVLDGL